MFEQRTLGQRTGKYPDSDLAAQNNSVLKSLILKELIRQVQAQFNDGEYQRKKMQKLRLHKKREKVQAIIGSYTSENKYITIPELSDLVEVTERSIERNLQNLQEQKKLIREGGTKGGFWQIM